MFLPLTLILNLLVCWTAEELAFVVVQGLFSVLDNSHSMFLEFIPLLI